MGKWVVTILCGFLLAGPSAAAAEGDAILGVWKTEEDENGYSHVEIFENQGRYHAKIIWLSEPRFPDDDPLGMAGRDKVDRENPDPQLRSRPIVGLEIMENFAYAGNRVWKNGRIYDPANGKTYKCKMWLDDDSTLVVRGFIGFSLLGRTTVWTRPAPER